MDFRRMRCFLVLAEELHFGRAAKRLHMTQPPLSVAMRGLEEELGVRLLERTTRSVRLTPAGELLQQRGRALMREVELTTRLVKQLGEGKSGSLAIGFIGIATLLGVPELIRRYREKHPKVAIELEERPSSELFERVRRSQQDVAFVRVLGDLESPFAHHPFARAQYALAIPESHALARRKRLSLSDLHEQALLFFPRSVHPAIHDQWLETFRRNQIEPRFVQDARSLQTELTLVAAGVGLALVADCVGQQLPPGVVLRPLRGELPTIDVHVVWNETNRSPTLAGLLSSLSGELG